jgi:hypothetical protein
MDRESFFSINVFFTSLNLWSELAEIIVRRLEINTLFAFVLVSPFEEVGRDKTSEGIL